MICCKSYQDIPDDPRDNYMDSEDYFDMFLTEFYKRNGIKDLSDENYETVRRWWYEFVNGRGEECDYGCDMTLEEMFAELKEYDENREKHTCETCERKRDDIFCSHCRTGCNDDYTLSDYWHSYTRIEKSLWGRIAQLQNDKGELTDKCKQLEKENEIFKKANEIIAQQRDGRDADISILEERNVELIDKVRELEARIEEMKCCENCAWWYKLPNGQRDCAETCENRDNWSLRR